MTSKKALIGVIMGSDSDWKTLEAATKVCEDFSVPYEAHVVSAHRTPDDMFDYAKNAHKKGLKIIIAGAGGAAHLPGMVASNTPLPVIGVPIKTESLSGMDALLSIVQMPNGVPVATVAIGAARNAALLAIEILATNNQELTDKLIAYKNEIADESRKKDKLIKK
ncbi:MAG: 5-(carboxyamino)imidazole ribonucleotide mutase [Legionellales bacterium]|jgi:5-(carboxyamino)imidazole ribonucleotide mutase|nr:5-(carboxyamino)imidazole ribonucleotide mutase [Legionellales bacterium]|tara:strand:- start:2407 stop:2901 length:495 start_codon:yes stop_codon:yes gene_type:complete